MLFNILNAMAAPETAFAFKTDHEKTIQLVAYHIKRQLSKTHYFALPKALGSLASEPSDRKSPKLKLIAISGPHSR